jgi:transcriptional regulator of acetoin/glycerol metabolism
MAKYRTSKTALARTFEDSPSLVYLVGQDWTIRYANRACAQWLEMDQEELFGRKLVYTSDRSPAECENRLNGLAPPPDCFLDQQNPWQSKSFLLARLESSNSLMSRWRWATACNLVEEDQRDAAVLVISQPNDLLERPEFLLDTSSASDMHSSLATLRNEVGLAYQLDSLIGISASAKRLRQQALMAAACDVPVYCFGPRGSGREHLARTIHFAHRDTADSDWVAIQGSLADGNQIKGVFKDLLKRTHPVSTVTDTSRNPTTVSRSSHVALLLLEADLLSQTAQYELYAQIISSKSPIRLLATGRRDLAELVEGGEYDPDLAALLSTMKIELVPLAQRPEDIPMLAQAMLERPTRKNRVSGFDAAALQMLAEYRWPGNLDQLSWVVSHSGENVRDRLLTPPDLPEKFQHWLRAQQLTPSTELTIDLDQYLASIERELLLRAMAQAKGNKTQAAKLLGLSRAKLLRRIEHLGLHVESNENSSGGKEQASARTDLALEPVAEDTDTVVRSPQLRPSRLREKLLSRPIPEEIELDTDEPVGDQEQGDDWISPDAFEEVD